MAKFRHIWSLCPWQKLFLQHLSPENGMNSPCKFCGWQSGDYFIKFYRYKVIPPVLWTVKPLASTKWKQQNIWVWFIFLNTLYFWIDNYGQILNVNFRINWGIWIISGFLAVTYEEFSRSRPLVFIIRAVYSLKNVLFWSSFLINRWKLSCCVTQQNLLRGNGLGQ